MTSIPVNRTGYFPVVEMDKHPTVRMAQYFLFLFVLLYTVFFNTRIIYVIMKNEKLRIPANWIICCILICDIIIVFNFEITGTSISFFEEVWLSELTAGVVVFSNLFYSGTQRWYLALASLEKCFYILLVYKHHRVFDERKTFCYIAVLTVLSFIVSCMTASTNGAGYKPETMTCFVAYESYTKTYISGKFTMVVRLVVEVFVFVFAFLLQVITFIFSYNVAKSDVTLNRHGIVWKRMIGNFISLFSVTFVIGLGAAVMKISSELDYPIFVRTSTLIYIFGPPVLNPLIVLFGNPPVRDSFLKKKKVFLTNCTLKNDERICNW